MKNRILAFVGAVCILSTLMIGTAFAGGWRLGSKGWWYDLQDGIAERYYFDHYGWMYQNRSTPDGYIVDDRGAWTMHGEEVTKGIEEIYEVEEVIQPQA